MSIRADIQFHLIQISDAAVAAKAGFDGAKSNRQTLVDLAEALCRQLDGINGLLTGDDRLASYAEKMADDIHDSFDRAAQARAA